jgi:hypothetical protein
VATAGDLLVLVRNPGKLVKYSSDAIADRLAGETADAIETPLAQPNLASVEPTGFTITLAGDILVATSGGQVLQFNSTARPRAPASSRASPAAASTSRPGSRGRGERIPHRPPGWARREARARRDLHRIVTGASAPVGRRQREPQHQGRGHHPEGALVTVAPTSAELVTYEFVSTGGSTKSQAFLVCGLEPEARSSCRRQSA